MYQIFESVDDALDALLKDPELTNTVSATRGHKNFQEYESPNYNQMAITPTASSSTANTGRQGGPANHVVGLILISTKKKH